MWHKIKIFFVFFLIAFLICLLLVSSYLRVEINYLSWRLNSLTLLEISFLVVFIIALLLWREKVDDESSREEFVSVITHKFRTPLTGVKWSIEMLRNNITEQQKQDILAQMENSNQRLLEIVDLMIGFAQFDKHLDYAYEATSLREIVDVSLQKYSDQIHVKNINFQIGNASTLPLVITDKRKIQFVIDMLIDNAIKYTPAGGAINIDFQNDGNYLTLSVADNGMGIDAADRPYIFKKFYRSKKAKTAHTEGMGLGLYTARAIVKKHHGKIWFESKGLGKGATFFVSLKIKS